MPPKTKKYINPNKPIHITDDVWFYVTSKGFKFVVWSKVFKGRRDCTQFRVTRRKLSKFMK